MEKKRPGRPPKSSGRKEESLLVKLSPGEKSAFKSAADLAGIGMSAWVRERLRQVARRELEEANLPVPFIKAIMPE